MLKIRQIVLTEIAHRKLNFSLALLTIAIAVACSVATLTLVHAYQMRTRERIIAHEAVTKEQIALQHRLSEQQIKAFQKQHADRVGRLDDEIRKITKAMGFNINILPHDLNLADFHADDFGDKTMPYEFVERLANSRDVVTINHLRPALIRKIEWTEYKRQIVMMGVSGVVPWRERRNPKKPLARAVPEGTMNVGSVLAVQLQLRKGQDVQLKGETFRVNEIYSPRGNKDDITVWIDLPKAQELLGLPGRVNLIQALECNCATIDRLAEIQQEVSRVLGDKVQIIELSTTAIARAKARMKVAAEGQASLQKLREQGQATLVKMHKDSETTIENLQAEGVATIERLQKLTTVLLPMLILTTCLIVGLLALVNVRQRQAEIGILRAIGLRAEQIRTLFMSKSLILGVLGAVMGYAAGFFGAGMLHAWTREAAAPPRSLASLVLPGVALAVFLLTPLLAALASWLPAMVASSQDPAVVLRQK